MLIRFLRNATHQETGIAYKAGDIAEVPGHAALFWLNARAVEPVQPTLETATTRR